jgi:hypothetical protein
MRLSLDALRMPLVGLIGNNLKDLLKSMKTKTKAQVKSKFYYIFWGTATASVLLGQLYVGTGYRLMAGSINAMMQSIEFIVEPGGLI